MEILLVYIIKRDFVIIRDLYREMKIFPAKFQYNQRFAIAGFVIAREYCIEKEEIAGALGTKTSHGSNP